MAYFKCACEGSGTPGTPGANGLSVLSGHLGVGETPADAVPTAQPGDFFIDLSSPEYTMYGPMVKATPSSPPDWSNTKSLIGPAGTTIHHGDGTPPNNVGNIDDYWLDLSGYYLYGPKTASDTWVGAQVKLLIGADGDPGADALWNFTGPYDIGASYAEGDVATYGGQTWYCKAATSGNDPAEGIFWTLLAAKGNDGAAGAAGNTIRTFDVDPSSYPGADLEGKNGDYWLNKSTYVLYGPKAADVWPTTGHALTGAAGDAGSQIVAGDETPGDVGSPVSDALLAGDYYIRLNPSPVTLYGPKPSDISWSGAPSFPIEGTKGDTGDPGTKIHSGSSDPVPSPTYAPGDFFINTTDKRLWGPADSSGNFVSYIDLTGQTGPQGPRGSAILSGDRTPVDGVDGSLGVDGVTGDFWINTTDPAALVLYGPKTSLGAWGSGRQLNGQNGVNGTDGKSIIAAASAPTGGKVGDLFLDTSVTGAPVLYGPKTSLGAWPYIADLKGDKGDKGDFGGAVFEYTLTASNPPGAAEARFNSPLSQLSNATELFIYNTDGNGANIAPYLGLIDDSTSLIKGTVKVEKQSDQTVFAYFSIKDVTVASGASGVSTVGTGNMLEYLTGNGTFAANDAVYISFMRTGDKGDPGTGGASSYYGSFYSTTTQTVTADTVVLMEFEQPAVFASGVSIVADGSNKKNRITIANPGVYNLQFSAQFHHTGGQAVEVNIWFRKNGVNIADSDTRIDIAASGEYAVAAWNFMVELTEADFVSADPYFEIACLTTHSGVTIETVAAAAPAPAIPSVILTVDRIAWTGMSAYEVWESQVGNNGKSVDEFFKELRGISVWSDTTTPAAETKYKLGDFYIDLSSPYKDLYGPYTGSAWPTPPVQLKGQDGATGPAATVLPSWFYGSGTTDITISSNTTLTAPAIYNNMTIAAGVSVNTGGYPIFVCGTLTMEANSAIHRDGASASGAGGAGTGYSNGSTMNAPRYGGSGSGGAGTSTTGGGVGSVTGALSMGGSGGMSGNGILGGSATGASVALGGTENLSNINALTTGASFLAAPVVANKLAGGCGGGGGGAISGTGGGGGAGAGFVVVFAHKIVAAAGSRISANGGAGGAGTGTSAHGGGGGGGGVVIVVSSQTQGTTGVSLAASGGAGGAKTGTATAGVNGAAGTTKYFVWS